MRWLVAFVLTALLGWAQNPPPAQSGAAMDNEWDLRKLIDSLSTESKRLKPLLDQADPSKWEDKSAATSYAAQWKSAQNEIQYLGTTAVNFAKEPERLTLALETLFRLESLERTLASYSNGLKRYGNPAVAELIDGVARENVDNREHLRQYVSELAQTKEQEFRIADQEAQRCRNTLSRQPPAPAVKKK